MATYYKELKLSKEWNKGSLLSNLTTDIFNPVKEYIKSTSPTNLTWSDNNFTFREDQLSSETVKVFKLTISNENFSFSGLKYKVTMNMVFSLSNTVNNTSANMYSINTITISTQCQDMSVSNSQGFSVSGNVVIEHTTGREYFNQPSRLYLSIDKAMGLSGFLVGYNGQYRNIVNAVIGGGCYIPLVDIIREVPIYIPMYAVSSNSYEKDNFEFNVQACVSQNAGVTATTTTLNLRTTLAVESVVEQPIEIHGIYLYEQSRSSFGVLPQIGCCVDTLPTENILTIDNQDKYIIFNPKPGYSNKSKYTMAISERNGFDLPIDSFMLEDSDGMTADKISSEMWLLFYLISDYQWVSRRMDVKHNEMSKVLHNSHSISPLRRIPVYINSFYDEPDTKFKELLVSIETNLLPRIREKFPVINKVSDVYNNAELKEEWRFLFGEIFYVDSMYQDSWYVYCPFKYVYWLPRDAAVRALYLTGNTSYNLYGSSDQVPEARRIYSSNRNEWFSVAVMDISRV